MCLWELKQIILQSEIKTTRWLFSTTNSKGFGYRISLHSWAMGQDWILMEEKLGTSKINILS